MEGAQDAPLNLMGVAMVPDGSPKKLEPMPKGLVLDCLSSRQNNYLQHYTLYTAHLTAVLLQLTSTAVLNNNDCVHAL